MAFARRALARRIFAWGCSSGVANDPSSAGPLLPRAKDIHAGPENFSRGHRWVLHSKPGVANDGDDSHGVDHGTARPGAAAGMHQRDNALPVTLHQASWRDCRPSCAWRGTRAVNAHAGHRELPYRRRRASSASIWPPAFLRSSSESSIPLEPTTHRSCRTGGCLAILLPSC